MPTQNQASQVKQVSHAMSSTNAVVVQPLTWWIVVVTGQALFSGYIESLTQSWWR
jgi:hypothetical protein